MNAKLILIICTAIAGIGTPIAATAETPAAAQPKTPTTVKQKPGTPVVVKSESGTPIVIKQQIAVKPGRSEREIRSYEGRFARCTSMNIERFKKSKEEAVEICKRMISY